MTTETDNEIEIVIRLSAEDYRILQEAADEFGCTAEESIAGAARGLVESLTVGEETESMAIACGMPYVEIHPDKAREIMALLDARGRENDAVSGDEWKRGE